MDESGVSVLSDTECEREGRKSSSWISGQGQEWFAGWERVWEENHTFIIQRQAEVSEQLRVRKSGWNMTRIDQETDQTGFSSSFLTERKKRRSLCIFSSNFSPDLLLKSFLSHLKIIWIPSWEGEYHSNKISKYEYQRLQFWYLNNFLAQKVVPGPSLHYLSDCSAPG